MFNKFEIIGGGISIGFMALALYLVQLETAPKVASQPAQVIATETATVEGGVEASLRGAMSANGKLMDMVIDDVKIGVGEEVKEGDVVSVHYVGTLQNGQEFDNSKKRGAPFEFKVGGGQVIKGWEEGLVGMKEGGQRILVIPPEKAYGKNGIGPIPGDATLVFAIELLEIK